MMLVRSVYLRTYLTGIVLLLISITLSAYSAHHPELGRVGMRMVDTVFYPFQTVYRGIISSVYDLSQSYIFLRGVEQENQELKSRLVILEEENTRLLEYRYQNESLQKQLEFIPEERGESVIATVISWDPTNWEQVVTINKGADHGVQVDSPVLEGAAIVGKVVGSSSGTSRVLLLTDYRSGLDALIQDTRARGVVEGIGRKRLRWNFVRTEEVIQVGDRVVSSGLDGIYPKGFRVGVVAHIGEKQGGELFHDVILDPAVNFSRLETVRVILPVKSELSEDAEGGGDEE